MLEVVLGLVVDNVLFITSGFFSLIFTEHVHSLLLHDGCSALLQRGAFPYCMNLLFELWEILQATPRGQ